MLALAAYICWKQDFILFFVTDECAKYARPLKTTVRIMTADLDRFCSLTSITDREIETIERSVCLSVDINSVQPECNRKVFESGLDWLERFIMRSHPELGRRGEVCPFVKPAHSEGSLAFCIWDVKALTFDMYVGVLKKLPALYRRLYDKISCKSRIFSVCIFVNGLREEQYFKFIDEAHSIVKPHFMAAGLMIGEFHPLSVVPGVHSSAFRPMRSNRPAFVLRAMAPHDSMFIDRDGSHAETRLRELTDYLLWLGGVLPKDEVRTIERRIAELELEIANRNCSRVAG